MHELCKYEKPTDPRELTIIAIYTKKLYMDARREGFRMAVLYYGKSKPSSAGQSSNRATTDVAEAKECEQYPS